MVEKFCIRAYENRIWLLTQKKKKKSPSKMPPYSLLDTWSRTLSSVRIQKIVILSQMFLALLSFSNSTSPNSPCSVRRHLKEDLSWVIMPKTSTDSQLNHLLLICAHQQPLSSFLWGQLIHELTNERSGRESQLSNESEWQLRLGQGWFKNTVLTGSLDFDASAN